MRHLMDKSEYQLFVDLAEFDKTVNDYMNGVAAENEIVPSITSPMTREEQEAYLCDIEELLQDDGFLGIEESDIVMQDKEGMERCSLVSSSLKPDDDPGPGSSQTMDWSSSSNIENDNGVVDANFGAISGVDGQREVVANAGIDHALAKLPSYNSGHLGKMIDTLMVTYNEKDYGSPPHLSLPATPAENVYNQEEAITRMAPALTSEENITNVSDAAKSTNSNSSSDFPVKDANHEAENKNPDPNPVVTDKGPNFSHVVADGVRDPSKVQDPASVFAILPENPRPSIIMPLSRSRTNPQLRLVVAKCRPRPVLSPFVVQKDSENCISAVVEENPDPVSAVVQEDANPVNTEEDSTPAVTHEDPDPVTAQEDSNPAIAQNESVAELVTESPDTSSGPSSLEEHSEPCLLTRNEDPMTPPSSQYTIRTWWAEEQRKRKLKKGSTYFERTNGKISRDKDSISSPKSSKGMSGKPIGRRLAIELQRLSVSYVAPQPKCSRLCNGRVLRSRTRRDSTKENTQDEAPNSDPAIELVAENKRKIIEPSSHEMGAEPKKQKTRNEDKPTAYY